jgi:hypothetical protein
MEAYTFVYYPTERMKLQSVYIINNILFPSLIISQKLVRFEVFTAVTMKNVVFWDVTPCGSCKNRRFGEPSASFIRVKRIGEIGTTLAT